MFWNEYGTKNIPPRPLLRTTAATKSQAWVTAAKRLLRSGMSMEAMLKNIGELMAGDIRLTLSQGNNLFQPNAPRTAKRKGFNTPLRDTGVLLRSFAWELRDGTNSEDSVV